MVDILGRDARSRLMARIGGRGTRIEVAVRKALFARGYRYRVNVGRLPGRPDIVLPRHRVAIFVHGCFWHGHDCTLFRIPASNREFWAAKLARNRERDARSAAMLQELGWRVAVVWECALRGRGANGLGRVADCLERWIDGTDADLRIRA